MGQAATTREIQTDSNENPVSSVKIEKALFKNEGILAACANLLTALKKANLVNEKENAARKGKDSVIGLKSTVPFKKVKEVFDRNVSGTAIVCQNTPQHHRFLKLENDAGAAKITLSTIAHNRHG